MTYSISNEELERKPDLKAGDVITFKGEELTVQASEDGSMLYVVTSGGMMYLVGIDGKDIR